MLHFLYQTKTLSQLPWKVLAESAQSSSVPARRFLNIQHVYVDSDKSKRRSGASRTGRQHVRRFPSTTSSWTGPDDSIRNDIPWHMDSKSIQRGDGSSDSVADLDGFRDLNYAEFEHPDERMEGSGDKYEAMDEIARLTLGSASSDRPSTITPSERQAFQKIFSEIFAKSKQSSTTDIAHGEAEDSASEHHRSKGDWNGDSDHRTARAEKDIDDLMTITPDEAAQGQAEKEKAVNRYPPALRAAAARAIGLADSSAKTKDANKSDAELKQYNEQLETLRQPERDRVEALMRNAKNDFELWAVMEKEVFSLVSKLGLEDMLQQDQSATSVKPKGKRNSKSKAAADTKPISGAMNTVLKLPDSETVVSPLEVYGPLYPSYLLLGLRLLDRSFAKPSPFTISILPKIKSLGLISHVLGASTKLYNELLTLYWFQRDDFRGVITLLEEMEQSGLDWDNETLDIVNTISYMHDIARAGKRGPTIQAVWSLPDFAPRDIRVWLSKIRTSLEEKRQVMNQPSY